MVKLTMIARATNVLPPVEGLDNGWDQKDSEFYKQQAKLLLKKLSKGQHEASRMSDETGSYIFQYPVSLAILGNTLKSEKMLIYEFYFIVSILYA
jgi:hypothetical protein